jgi:hypothetical protein
MNGKLIRIGTVVYSMTHPERGMGRVAEIVRDTGQGPVKVLFKVKWAYGVTVSEEQAQHLRKTPPGTSNQNSGFNGRVPPLRKKRSKP